jgi:uncharacterized caspase-like protein
MASTAFAPRVLMAAIFLSPMTVVAQAPQSEAAGAEARIALGMGNADYPNVPLKNPSNDVRDLSKALTDLGFSVNLLVEADFASMNPAIRDFGNAIKRPDAVALFYYSAHGAQ